MNADRQPHRLAILGAGAMGVSVATVALGYSIPVVLIDVEASALEQAARTVDDQLRLGRRMGCLPPGQPAGQSGPELVTSLSVERAAGATAVVEAVTEQAVVKAKALTAVCRTVTPGTPLLSCTWGIPIDEVADWAGRPADVVGARFMMPPFLVRDVEVTWGRRAASETVAAATELLTMLNRQLIEVGDAPGMVTARLLHPMINTAARIVGTDGMTAEDVDTLMQDCLRNPYGPLRTADQIGIDSLVDTLQAIYERTGDESCRPCQQLLDKVNAGELGVKSGHGFYAYADGA